MKKPLLWLILGLFLVSFASAVCTTTLNKAQYRPLETATATILCNDNADRSKAYTLNWYNGTKLVETDTGTTPSSLVPFFETYNIPNNVVWTNANATFLLSGVYNSFDDFNVSGSSATSLIINDAKFSPYARRGTLFSVDFEVTDSNLNTLSNADCTIFGTDSNNAPLQICGEVHTHNGRAVCAGYLDSESFIDGQEYLAKIRCNCLSSQDSCFNQNGTQIMNRSGESTFEFTVTPWITVNTITDKLAYTLDDNQILVCANVTSNLTQRITLEILYNYRCDGNDTASNRIIVDEHREVRGISANTTQNQCATLKIKNLQTLQNKVNICYAGTDVRVLKTNANDILVTYPTTSPIFTITSDSSTYVEGDSMLSMIPVAIILIGLIFFLIYFSQQISVRDDNNNVVPLNSMFVMILWTSAVYMAFMTLQIAVGIALVNTSETEILSGLMGIFRFGNSIVTIVFILLIIGIFINLVYAAFEYISRKYLGGSR